MQITRATSLHPHVPFPAALAAPAPAPEAPPSPADPEEQEDRKDDDFWENLSRLAGKLAHGVTHIPQALAFVPEFVKFALFDGVLPLLGLAAQIGGVVGTVGVGIAGGLELTDGIRRHDPAKILAGGGEISRGLFLGSLAAGSWGHPELAQSGRAFGYLHGGLNLASGALKMRQGARLQRTDKKIVGMLEIGMGACTVAAMQASPYKVPLLVLQGGLAAGKFAVTHRSQLKEWAHKVGERAHETWDNFKAIFRDDETPPPEDPPQTTLSDSYWKLLSK
jgi:hypothetical protein